uniref:Cysteine-rich receptor-like protein kinase 10 n=1 Tax=Quercus lobata TaxID=97700 RepID=A0A7N2MBU7_QUELO
MIIAGLPKGPKLTQNYAYVNCNTANNYTSGSVYEQNLNLTLTFLVANSSINGFYITSVGQNLDAVYGLIQCIGDLSNKDCQTCAYTAATEIRSNCYNEKEAAIVNVNDATDMLLFKQKLEPLPQNISSDAAASPSKFANGVIGYTVYVNIYAMAQCTRDLLDNRCLICLQGLISYIPKCCDKKVGSRIYTPSCNLRFEIYSFFLSPLPPPPPEVSSKSFSSPSLPENNPTTTRTTPENNVTTTGTSKTTSNHAGKKNNSEIFVLVIPLAVALVVISIIFGYFLWRRTTRKRVESIHEGGDKSSESLLMGLSTLKVATRNFSEENKLGEGGFGPVYKGKLLDGREKAVKRLSRSSGQGLEELKTEVVLVAKLLHWNLVRLLGFCLEDEEKLLVHEYLPNGSLDKILFDMNNFMFFLLFYQRKQFSLEWEKRYKIIIGIARGLLYLHEDSQLRIIHRDLKTSNILLDENMNPKISDFALAKLFDRSQTQGNTNQIAGTYRYMAPEYAKNGKFSAKSDVYGFGILVLEIVWQHWGNGMALELLDPSLGDQCPRYEVMKCIHIGLLCIQEAAANRPTMSQIVMMLSAHSTITSQIPSRPAFLVTRENPESDLVTEDAGASSQQFESKPEPSQKSINEVTINDLDPR